MYEKHRLEWPIAKYFTQMLERAKAVTRHEHSVAKMLSGVNAFEINLAVSLGAAVGGEVISVFGTGFGPSLPPTPAGSLPPKSEPLAGSAQVIMGNATAQLTYAGIVGAGMVQLTFVVPIQGPSGLRPIQASVNGVFTPEILYLPVQKN